MEDALLDGVSSNNIRAVVQLLQSGHVSVSCRARTSGLTPLQIAAREGYHQLVRVLLEHKANVNSLHHATRLNALHYAVAEDRVMACEAILSFCRQTESTKHLHDLLHQQAARGMAAIHMACARGSVPLVELLLQYNASLNAPDARKLRPLHHAVIERHAPVAELLIDRGASLDAVDKHRMSPLLYAVMNHALPLTTLLLERRCQVNLPDRRMQTPLMRAAKDGHFDLASLLLEYMADPCPKLPEPERDPDPDSSVLLLAVRANQLDFVRALLVRYQLLPLHAVVFLDDGRVVVNTPPKLLLPSATTDTSTSSTADHSDVPTQSLQSPPQPSDSTTQSTLRAELDRATKTAIRLGFFDVAKVLLASRDDLDAAKLDDLQCRIAATPHSTTSAALLSNLLDWNAEPSARALVVAYANNYCCVNSLLHAKVSIHGTNSRGETPLHIAASHSDPSTALLSSLLLSGADLNAKTNSGRQPIHYVRELAHLKLLLEYSANINARDNDNRTLLLTNTDMYSCENLELLSAILEAKALPHVYSPAKDVCSTPMHVAAHCGSIESVRVLLAADANVNARNVDDATPLHLAVARYRDDYTLPKHIAQERSVDLVYTTHCHTR